MPIPQAIKIGISLASTAMQAMQTSAAGKAEQQAANARATALNYQAAQARQAAGQERAAGQRNAMEQRRQARLVSSRALARAAASGGGTGGTVETILGDIGAEGEFRALNELFIGEERARGREMQADARTFEAGDERRAGAIARGAANRKAGMGLLSSGVSMYEKYGGKDNNVSKDNIYRKKRT